MTEPFEDHREHLRGVAYRMLGSLAEADDAVQEAWLRLHRADTAGVANLRGWLTTVVARVCLDMLRARKSRREDSVDAAPAPTSAATPASELAMADAIGLALLVVLDTLEPAERLAFVLHDMFAVPFEDIAEIVHKTPAAARQLASRARRRVQGAPVKSEAELAEQRQVVAAFLAALRAGDLPALIAVLDPDVLVRTDIPGAPETRGAEKWARGAVAFGKLAEHVELALVDGVPGLVLAPNGKLVRVIRFEQHAGKITSVEILNDRDRVAELEIAIP